ncbi:hypothetical protein [Motiliproteus sp. SC1-56]|uniref:hypothetical protein n=1 Tax=Motiliproteus sp. SC1-56 TaxID=2799565 RepID=UPI001A8E21CA|nr:hypothetical protein [Motiliproteus sp. SC1-56]
MRLLTALLPFLRQRETSEKAPTPMLRNRQAQLAKYRPPEADPGRRHAFQQRLSRLRSHGLPLRQEDRARYDRQRLRASRRKLAS